MSDREDRYRELLHEGLNLCVRARKMDAIDRRNSIIEHSSAGKEWEESGDFDERYVARHNFQHPHAPVATKSGTVHLWVQEQYERDLAEWEQKARAALSQ